MCNAIKETIQNPADSSVLERERKHSNTAEVKKKENDRREQCSRFKNASFMFYEKGEAFITFCDKCTQCKHPEGSARLISAK